MKCVYFKCFLPQWNKRYPNISNISWENVQIRNSWSLILNVRNVWEFFFELFLDCLSCRIGIKEMISRLFGMSLEKLSSTFVLLIILSFAIGKLFCVTFCRMFWGCPKRGTVAGAPPGSIPGSTTPRLNSMRSKLPILDLQFAISCLILIVRLSPVTPEVRKITRCATVQCNWEF